jgi:hypothetical protein
VIGGNQLHLDGPFHTIKLLYYCGLAVAGLMSLGQRHGLAGTSLTPET